MGRPGRGRGNSSSTRGPGQHSTRHRIGKSPSQAATTSAILLTAPDQHRLSPLPRPPRSPIGTRGAAAAAAKKPLAPGTATGQQQKPADDGGPSSSTPGIVPTIPTINEYAMLSDSGDDDVDDDKNPTQQAAARAAKEWEAKMKECTLPRVRDRPPLIYCHCLASVVDDLLTPPDVQYVLKVTKLAVQVLATNQKNYDKALEILKANKVQFYTFDCRSAVSVKVVLQGLGEMAISAVREKLQEFRISPREIKILSKKTTTTGTHVLYLLYFDKGTVKIQDLRRVKCLFGYLVNWRFFTKRPTDAAQCHRCQKFGHGSRNCNMAPRCVKCGKDHLTEGCALPRKESLGDKKIAEKHKPAVKCANCGGNHTANFRGCKARKNYIELQEKKKTPVSSSSPSSTTQRAAGQVPAHPPGLGRSYASVVAGLDAAPEPGVNADGDLFSLTEFLILARDMYQQLSSCRNKQQQFMALSQLMMKYVCVV